MGTTNRLSTEDIVEHLSRGGLAVPEKKGHSESTSGVTIPNYNVLRDPQAAEQLGRELARELDTFEPTAVLIWEAPYDVVLGFIVARELSVRAIRSYDVEGLVGFDGTFDDGGRLVLVGDAFRQAEPVRAMYTLAQQHNHQVVAAGSLVAIDGPGPEELDRAGVPLVSLADMEEIRRGSSA